MIRTILVEDEVLVRLGLKATIDWDRLGLELVGEAGNGEEGWQVFLQEQPDLVLTDIRMPLLDGLGLIERIRQSGARAEIVILTYYKDFEYLKEAVRLGVPDYVVKVNLDREELHGILASVVRRITESTSRDREQERLAFEARLGKIEARRRFLQGLLFGEYPATPPTELKERWLDHGLPVGESYGVLAVSLDGMCHLLGLDRCQAHRLSQYTFKLMEEALLEVAGAEPLILKENEIGVVVTCPRSQQAQWEKINGLASMLREAVTRFTRHTATVGVGAPAPSIAELPRAYGQATMGVSDRFFHGGDHTVRGDLVEPRQGRNAALNRETATQLRLLVQQGSSAQLHRWLEKYKEELKAGHDGEEHLRQLFTRLFALVDQGALEAGIEFPDRPEGKADWLRAVSCCDTLDGLGQEWLCYAEQMRLMIRDEEDRKKYSPLVRRIAHYAAEHLADDLRVKDLAARMGVSPNYLSQVFSQETGEHFIEYVNRLRTEHACQFLRSTSLSAAEVGRRVGFEDPKYFYRVFKNATGHTPAEYRREGLDETSGQG